MDSKTSTITVRRNVKDRLAQAKGDRSWDDFLEEVANEYLDVAIALAEKRLGDLRAHKARSVGLDEIGRDVEALREGGTPDVAPRTPAKKPVDSRRGRGGKERDPCPRR